MTKGEDYCLEITRFWGLFSYHPQWGLTPWGWLVLGLVLLLIIGLILLNIHPFLAVRKPVEADILLVEGWVSDDVIIGAIKEFYQGNYQLILTTGSPLIKGHFLSEYKNFADLAAATLVSLGLDKTKIISIPSPVAEINRTQTAALTVRNWLLNHSQPPKGINIYSWDVHTRRSWLLYRSVLQPEFKVGAIAHPPQFYNPNTWWTSSAGVRSILPEAIAYLYAKLFQIFY